MDTPFFQKPEGKAVWEAIMVDGLSPREAQLRLCLGSNTVSNYLKYWRDKGFEVPKFQASPTPKTHRILLTFSNALVMRLKRHADKRNIPTEEMVRRLVTVLVDDDLIDGVLDDLNDVAA